MAEAFECDRCNQLYSGTPASTIEQDGGLTKINESAQYGADLCEGCSIEFDLFMKKDNNGD